MTASPLASWMKSPPQYLRIPWLVSFHSPKHWTSCLMYPQGHLRDTVSKGIYSWRTLFMSVTGENTDKTCTSNWRWSVSVVPQHLQLFFQFLSLWLFSNSSVKVKNKIFLGRSICTSRRSRGICEQAAQKLLRLSTSYNLVEMSRRWGKTRIEKWNFISWANMYQHPLRAW